MKSQLEVAPYRSFRTLGATSPRQCSTLLLILCKTKRQMNRCRRRMMEILHERHLSLSRKKSRMGCINRGFHFLGIHYSPTQTGDNTNVIHANDGITTPFSTVHNLSERGG